MTDKTPSIETIDLRKYNLGLFRPAGYRSIYPDCPWEPVSVGKRSRFEFHFPTPQAATQALAQWQAWCTAQGPRKLGNDYKVLLERARRMYEDDVERQELELLRAGKLIQTKHKLVFTFDHPAAGLVMQNFWLAYNADYVRERAGKALVRCPCCSLLQAVRSSCPKSLTSTS